MNDFNFSLGGLEKGGGMSGINHLTLVCYKKKR
jgi:hypothetical protein